MPFNIPRQGFGLFCQLLWTTFPKYPLPCIIGLLNGYGRMEFGNCHQLDLRWQLTFYLLEIFGNHITFCFDAGAWPVLPSAP